MEPLPLPEEIQAMSPEETVCQFCGVSYLIHREYRKMKAMVEELSDKVAMLKGYEEEFPALQTELVQARERFAALHARSRETDELLAASREETCLAAAKLEAERAQCAQLGKALDTLRGQHKATVETQEERVARLSEQWRGLLAVFGSTAHAHRHANAQLSSMMDETCAQVNGKVAALTRMLANERDAHTLELATLGAELENNRLFGAEVQRRHSEEVRELWDKVKAAEADAERAAAAVETIKQSEATLKLTVGREQSRGEQKEHDIDALKASLKEAQKLIDGLSAQVGKFQGSIMERDRLASQQSVETSRLHDAALGELRGQLLRTQQQLQGERSEREQTILAHQSRIQQLQAKFLEDIEKLSQHKLETALRENELKYHADVQMLRAALEEQRAHQEANFTMLTAEHTRSLASAREQAAAQLAEMRLALQHDAAARLQELEVKSDAEARQLHGQLEQQRAEASSFPLRLVALQGELAERDAAIVNLKAVIKQECEERLTLQSTVSLLKAEMQRLVQLPQQAAQEQPHTSYTAQPGKSSDSAVDVSGAPSVRGGLSAEESDGEGDSNVSAEAFYRSKQRQAAAKKGHKLKAQALKY